MAGNARKYEVTYSTHEVSLMIALVSELDPDRYITDSAKALIYKTRTNVEPGTGEGKIIVNPFDILRW